MTDSINVLDRGYVRLRDHMGDDLTIVNAARVSYDKRSDFMESRDERLLRFLTENEHTSPFRHATLQFEIYAPLMVMRQWGKYRVGSVWSFEDSDDPIESWNESSRRYVTEEPTFYVPEVWRSAPENSKQGSGEPIHDWGQEIMTAHMQDVIRETTRRYREGLNNDVCAEQARLFLPAYAMYIRAMWTVSLGGVLHFLDQRLKEDAQWEIQQYAQAVRNLAAPLFPKTFELMGLVDAASND